MRNVRRAAPAVLTAVLVASGLSLAASPADAGRVSTAEVPPKPQTLRGITLDTDWGDGAHGKHRHGRVLARTTTVDPAAGPDFELPFPCGQRWIGSTRKGHSPSAYSIDFNTNSDLGRPVVSSAPGVVIKAVALTSSYGRYVIVDHGRGYTTLYAHLNGIAAQVGQYVDQGDLLGYVGSSGNSTGPHLHYEQRLNGAYFAPYFHRVRFPMGTTATSYDCPDRPITGDWNGDRRTDIGIYRTAATSGQYFKRLGTTNSVILYGKAGDVGFTGDWNGDRVSDIGIRPIGTPRFTTRAANGSVFGLMNYGITSDVPVTGDWNGNRTTDPGLWRASSRQFLKRRPDASTEVVSWGAAGDRPVSGDWNGDGITDVGVFSPSTGYWSLRLPSGGTHVLQKIGFGSSTDIPVTGDWNGDGRWEIGVWRPSTAQYILRTQGTPAGRYVNQVLVMGNRRY